MATLKLTRLINGVLLLIGLLWFKPLAYLVALMMIFAGVTGICPMEKLLQKLGWDGGCGSK